MHLVAPGRTLNNQEYGGKQWKNFRYGYDVREELSRKQMKGGTYMAESQPEIKAKSEYWKITMALPVFDRNCGDEGIFVADHHLKAIQIFRMAGSKPTPSQDPVEDDYDGDDYE